MCSTYGYVLFVRALVRAIQCQYSALQTSCPAIKWKSLQNRFGNFATVVSTMICCACVYVVIIIPTSILRYAAVHSVGIYGSYIYIYIYICKRIMNKRVFFFPTFPSYYFNTHLLRARKILFFFFFW